jgi:parallel beta-helix repeat protein
MATYYVRKTGNNTTGTGTTGNPWLTIAKGHSVATSGDTLIVGDGTYNEAVTVKTGVTLRAENAGEARIRATSGNAVSGSNVNNVVVDGFDIKTTANHGIEIQSSHHITIRNVISHENPNSGISLPWGEFFLVENCICYGNGRGGWFSGITMYQARNITGDTATAGPRNIIRNCTVYDNWTTGGSTDGNGILMDDWQHTQSYGPDPATWLGVIYPYGGLIENCLAYGNGNKGIGLTWSDGIVVRNNTVYRNGIDGSQGTWRGDLSNQAGEDNTFANNIAVCDSGLSGTGSYNTAIGNYAVGSNGEACTGTIWFNNLTYDLNNPTDDSLNIDGPGCATPTIGNGNILGEDPDFVAAPTDFHLLSTSPAIDAGTAVYGLPSSDAEGNSRTVGVVDMGSFEYAAPSFTIDDADALKVGTGNVTAVYYGSTLIWGA